MNHYYPSPYVSPSARSHYEMARIGAVAGFCGAGARNLQRLQHRQIDRSEAAMDTLRAGLTAGLAAGAASVVSSQFRSPTLSVIAGIATGTAVVYGLERATSRGGAE
jgi:hypothetical protein